MKTFGKSAQGIGLDAAKSLQRQEGLRAKPLLRSLRRKGLVNILRLAFAGLAIQSHKKIRRTQVAIVLRDFVFQDEMAAKRIPSQFGDQPMILVKIMPVVGQNQIGSKLFFQPFEINFDARMERRKIAIAETPNYQPLRLYPVEKQRRRFGSLPLSDGSGTEHLPMNLATRLLSQEAKNRATASDFNVVTVRAQAKHPASKLSGLADSRSKHL